MRQMKILGGDKMRGDKVINGTGAIELERKAIKDGSIVLCVIPSRREYVTWWTGEGSHNATVQGHYTTSLEDALEDFNTRN